MLVDDWYQTKGIKLLAGKAELKSVQPAGTGIELLVVDPLSISQYGGDYVRAFTGVGDVWGVRRPACNDRFLFWDYTGSEVTPNVAKGYEMLGDGATLRLFLREGLEWSGGVPVTVDIILWWYENMYNNQDVYGTGRLAQLQYGGEDIVIEKVDDFTVDYKLYA